MQPDRSLQILGDRAGGEAADRVEGGPPQHRAAAAEERRVPAVLAALDHAKEQRLLGPHQMPARVLAVLVGVQVVKVLRRLHEGHRGIDEVAQRPGEEIAGGRVIGVEHGDQLGGAVVQGVVQIAGLGVRIGFASQVAAPQLFGQCARLRPIAVVQQPGLVRIVHALRGEQRPSQHVHRLVVAGDEDVHRDSDRRWR